MDVCFYAVSNKPFSKEIENNWVQIFLGYDDDDEEFSEGPSVFNEIKGAKAGKVPIFGNEYSDADAWKTETVLTEITKLCEKKHSEVVLVCDYDFFAKAVKRTSKDEMEANLLVTEDRGMLYYAAIGADECVLLVAYDGLYKYM